MVKNFRIIIMGVMMAVSFQNCSPSFYSQRTGSGNFSSSLCEGALKTAFSKTYYPFLSTAVCSQCHVPGGGGSGEFADSNVDNAYPQFMAKTYLKINQIAESSTHHFSAALVGNHTTAITNLTPQWMDAYGQYMSCLSSGSGTGSMQALATIKKTAPTGLIPATPPAGAMATGPYQTISWDLSSDAMAPNMGVYNATATLDVRGYYRNSVLVGFEFTKPTVALKTGVTTHYSFTGLHIGLDGIVMPNITTFEKVTGVVASTTAIILAPGSTSFYEYANAGANTQFELHFDDFSVTTADGTGIGGTGGGTGPAPLPTGVTYTTLTAGTGAITGAIFQNRCFGCHNATNKSGNFDITTFANASTNGNLILSRMQNKINPMPPSGLLQQSEVDYIQSWINSGKPN